MIRVTEGAGGATGIRDGTGWPALPAAPGLAWSACVRAGSEVVWEVRGDLALPTASVGKLLLLLETARALEAGELAPGEPLTRTPADTVADSGLWYRLAVDTLPAADIATLVGAVSDNLATNVLLRRLGLAAVDALRARLGLVDTRLLDQVRGSRDPQVHAPTLSTGTARELSLLAHRVAASHAVSPSADARVAGWLAANTDLSMVASAFGLDPLAHGPDDTLGGVLLWNKTGTDDGIRADVGHVSTAAGHPAYAYAVCARWDPAAGDLTALVLDGMRGVGDALARHLAG